MKFCALIFLSQIILFATANENFQSNEAPLNEPTEFDVSFDNAVSLEFQKGKRLTAKVLSKDGLRMTLVLEYMNCDPSKDSYLSINGEKLNHAWCSKVDHRSSDFTNTKFVAETAREFDIQLHTESDEISAILTVTAFREMTSGEDCDSSEFYCGKKKNGNARCISERHVCDNHANCGSMISNEDEKCCNGVYYGGYACDWYHWSFIWAAFFALVFITIVPTVVVVAICFRRKRRSRASGHTSRRHEVPVQELRNDHPPTYDDVQEKELPPPCFCSTIETPNNQGGKRCDCSITL
jgi:hypothetical protein